MQRSPRVSVVIPCRNENAYIAAVIRSVLDSQEPQGGMEILVIDGMSDDGTRDVLTELCQIHTELRVIDNPRRSVSFAMNLGIKAAKGDFIVRLDAHTYYPNDYIVRCVEWLEREDADNVGGVLVPQPTDDTLLGRALAQSLRHPFGCGNALHKTARLDKPKEVDTVAFGCFRKELFHRLGYFREDLARSQDMEFNNRIRQNGGKILLVPSIRSFYQVRSTLQRVIPYYWSNGFWALFPLKFGAKAFRLRHLVPLFFVSWLILFGLLGLWSTWARVLFALAAGSYATSAIFSAAHIAFRERKLEYVFTVPFAFALQHIVHGLGSAYAGSCLLLEKLLPGQIYVKKTPTQRV